MDSDGAEVALRHFVQGPARYGSSQFIEATLALDVRLARAMFGPQWRPIRLELMHGAPRNARFRTNFFGSPIEYGAARNALVLSSADMMRAQPNANPQMLRYLEQQIAGIARSWPQDFTQQVEQLVTANIAGGGADVDHVASLLALSRRTFQRRLAEHGLRFPEVLRQVRLRIADDYYATERRPNLAELAHRLGLADAGVASRFLRMHHQGARALKARWRE